MKYELQDIHTSKHGFEQMAELYARAYDLIFGEIELDFSKCGWFDGNMAAPLGAVLARISEDFNDIKITNLQPGVEAILRKNDFLIHYGFESMPDHKGTVVPYRRFQSREARLFLEYVRHFTAGKGIPTMTPELLKRFHFSLSELFSNAAQHAQSNSGVFAAGQFFPKKNRFDFCVTDAGIGFVGAIFIALEVEIDSMQAMQRCLNGRFTTKVGTPGGMGLKLLKRFIEMNGGRIVIVSNAAYYEFSRCGERLEPLAHGFPGTCIDIQIDTSDRKSYRLASSTQPPSSQA